MDELELKYIKSLAKQYPTIAAASTEIVNLSSIMNLPKGTEHFLTDIHGEYEQFNHVLKNGSGSVRRKIDEEFGNTLSNKDKKSLATLIYYPNEKLDIVMKEEENLEDWYKITLYRLVQITKRVSSKYTRSKVRKALPKDFAYVIEELITEKAEVQDKEAYYNELFGLDVLRNLSWHCVNWFRDWLLIICILLEIFMTEVRDHISSCGHCAIIIR